MEQAQLRLKEWEIRYWELIALREGFVQKKGPNQGKVNRSEAMRLALQFALTHMPPRWRPTHDDPMPTWWHHPTQQERAALGWQGDPGYLPPEVD